MYSITTKKELVSSWNLERLWKDTNKVCETFHANVPAVVEFDIFVHYENFAGRLSIFRWIAQNTDITH